MNMIHFHPFKQQTFKKRISEKLVFIKLKAKRWQIFNTRFLSTNANFTKKNKKKKNEKIMMKISLYQ